VRPLDRATEQGTIEEKDKGWYWREWEMKGSFRERVALETNIADLDPEALQSRLALLAILEEQEKKEGSEHVDTYVNMKELVAR
jgi:hypothetical protein